MLKKMILFLFASFSALAAQKPITFYTEQSPPYNYKDSKGHITGISVELLRHLHKNLGFPAPVIKIHSWARSYGLSQEPHARAAVFSTARTSKRESLFQWVGPIGSLVSAVIAIGPKEALKKVPTLRQEDLKKYTYAVVNQDVAGSYLFQEAKKAGIPLDHITTSQSLSQIVRLALKKRVQFVVYPLLPFKHFLKQHHPLLEAKDVYHLGKDIEFYFAFNKSIKPKTVHAYQEALKNLHTSEK